MSKHGFDRAHEALAAGLVWVDEHGNWHPGQPDPDIATAALVDAVERPNAPPHVQDLWRRANDAALAVGAALRALDAAEAALRGAQESARVAAVADQSVRHWKAWSVLNDASILARFNAL